jgi:hypothetical protein
MTFEITSQQRQMIATVRALAQSEFKAHGIKYMDGSFPWAAGIRHRADPRGDR